MALHLFFLITSKRTLITREWFDSMLFKHVVIQVRHLRCLKVANLTVYFDSHVFYVNVILQLRFNFCRIVASFFCAVISNPLMVCLYMELKHLPRVLFHMANMKHISDTISQIVEKIDR